MVPFFYVDKAVRIFLDVGAFTGDTAKAVLLSKYKFDRIECFEPQLSLCESLNSIEDSRVKVNNFGLWNRDCIRMVYWRTKKDGATIYSDKFSRARNSEECRFVKASTWFSHNLKQDDFVVLKMNCEGAECDILDDLFDSGEYLKIDALMVDLDVRKIPSQQHRELEIRERLKRYIIPAVSIIGTEEESKFTRAERNCYYNNRYRWTHLWMDKVL